MASPDKLASGVDFHSFRIPAVVRTATGRILAFAEGRRNTNQDFGDINLIFKRAKTTSDNGDAPGDWESLREVVGTGPAFGETLLPWWMAVLYIYFGHGTGADTISPAKIHFRMEV